MSPVQVAEERVIPELQQRVERAEADRTALLLRVERLEAERNVYAHALQAIRGPSCWHEGDPDPLGRAYRAAGGGYEGLQALADFGLAEAERILGTREEPIELIRGFGMTERATDEPCVGCGKEIQPGQAYVDGPWHLGCGRSA